MQNSGLIGLYRLVMRIIDGGCLEKKQKGKSILEENFVLKINDNVHKQQVLPHNWQISQKQNAPLYLFNSFFSNIISNLISSFSMSKIVRTPLRVSYQNLKMVPTKGSPTENSIENPTAAFLWSEFPQTQPCTEKHNFIHS